MPHCQPSLPKKPFPWPKLVLAILFATPITCSFLLDAKELSLLIWCFFFKKRRSHSAEQQIIVRRHRSVESSRVGYFWFSTYFHPLMIFYITYLLICLEHMYHNTFIITDLKARFLTSFYGNSIEILFGEFIIFLSYSAVSNKRAARLILFFIPKCKVSFKPISLHFKFCSIAIW